jgi:hypothetical protein
MIANPGGPGLAKKKPVKAFEEIPVDTCCFTNAGMGTPQPEESACLDPKNEALTHHPYKPDNPK